MTRQREAKSGQRNGKAPVAPSAGSHSYGRFVQARRKRSGAAMQPRFARGRSCRQGPEQQRLRLLVFLLSRITERWPVFINQEPGRQPLVKDTEAEDLISVIRVVARGDALLSPSVTRTLISSIAGRGPAQPLDASAGCGTNREAG